MFYIDIEAVVYAAMVGTIVIIAKMAIWTIKRAAKKIAGH